MQGSRVLTPSSNGVKKTARSFRNAEHFKTTIYFHCGGFDLYLHESRQSPLFIAPVLVKD